jgi:hypothetical protein
MCVPSCWRIAVTLSVSDAEGTTAQFRLADVRRLASRSSTSPDWLAIVVPQQQRLSIASRSVQSYKPGQWLWTGFLIADAVENHDQIRDTEQVPTTLTGLLLFVVLMLPGFGYLVGKERHGTERRLSPFRETVAIVAASVTSELIVLLLFASVRAVWPSITPDVGALVRNSSTYLRGGPAESGHYRTVAAWGVGMLIAASLLAYLATDPKIRRLAERVTGPYPHDSTVSGWWILFERWAGTRRIELVCMLDDGSCVRGQFGSFNTSADDSPDRDLILQRPIYYRPPGSGSQEVPYPAAAVCCAASRIVALFVNYFEPNQQVLTRLPEVTATVEEPVASPSEEAPMQEAL